MTRTILDERLESLFKAAEKGDIREVEKLIAAGADVNTLDQNGKTPLQLAKEKGHTKIIDALHKAAKTLSFVGEPVGKLEKSLVNYARRGNSKKVRKKLFEGADANVRDRFGNTLLHCLALLSTDMPSRSKTIVALIKEGADVNAQNEEGQTPLHQAARNGQTEIVKALIKAGADINVKDNDGQTPLDWATKKDYTGIVDKLQRTGKKRKGPAENESKKGRAAKSSRTTGTGFASAVTREREEVPAGGRGR